MDFAKPDTLVRACRSGDPAAWDHLLTRYGKLIWAITRHYKLSSDEAEEVFQRTWVAVVGGLHRVHDPDRLAAWIAAVTRHQVFRYLQEANRHRRVDHEPAAYVLPEVEENLEMEWRQACVHDAMAQLDPRCRMLLELLFFEEPPPDYQNVARLTGMAIGSIGPTRSRCLKKLKKLLVALYQTGRQSYSSEGRDV